LQRGDSPTLDLVVAAVEHGLHLRRFVNASRHQFFDLSAGCSVLAAKSAIFLYKSGEKLIPMRAD
jgi:hypothetical protein